MQEGLLERVAHQSQNLKCHFSLLSYNFHLNFPYGKIISSYLGSQTIFESYQVNILIINQFLLIFKMNSINGLSRFSICNILAACNKHAADHKAGNK